MHGGKRGVVKDSDEGGERIKKMALLG